MRVTAIVPARYGSTRFPGKPLAPLAGTPMVVRVARRLELARAEGAIDDFLVATDDLRIARVVREAGFEAQMTSPDHPTGTDRLAEVAAGRPGLEIVCNVQGDEPLIEPGTLAALVAPLREDPELRMGTVGAPLDGDRDRFDPNRVKLAVDARGRALTFTRLPIPGGVPAGQAYWNREAVERAPAAPPAVLLHVGVYAYRRDFLLEYARLERTPFERAERLEQLRALEHGYEMSAPSVPDRPLAVDTPEDAARVEAILRAEGG